MRLVLGLSGVFLAVVAASAAAPAKPAASQAEKQYTVAFRLHPSNEKGDPLAKSLTNPTLMVLDGKRASVSDRSQTPFVAGIFAVTDPSAKQAAEQPYIVVFEEGTKIEVIVTGRQFNGATVDVTVELSKIVDVKEKKIGPGTVLQIPTAETYKKRVVDFVNFGETLVVPLEDKGPKEARARLEMVVQPVEKRPSGKNSLDKAASADHGVPILSLTQCLGTKPPAPPSNEKAMMMVTPRIIVQDEEEEKMGVTVP
jgi:hypothetical protein